MDSDLKAVWRLARSLGLVAMIPTAVLAAGSYMLSMHNQVSAFSERIENLETSKDRDYDKIDKRMENLEKKIDKIWQHLAK